MVEPKFHATHYLRVEGVNLAHFVLDTAHLSIIRGGGLMLLRGINRPPGGAGPRQNHPPEPDNVADWLRRRLADQHVRPVSTGASSGLFALQLTGDPEAERLEADLRSFLRQHVTLGHATWVCDVLPASADFAADRERLLAANRFAQMHSPSLVAPEWNATPEATAVPPCAFDRLRPGTETAMMPPPPGETKPEDRPASPPARRRLKYGRSQRRLFYREEAGFPDAPEAAVEADAATEAESPEPAPDGFTQDLEELAGPPPPRGLPGQLRDKLAVLYFDGNKFGQLQLKQCRTLKAQRNFDEAVKGLRRELLRGLLAEMARDGTTAEANPGWFSRRNNRRLETLLWGGDEILWVVPAWQGWAVLDFFFRTTADWTVTLADDRGIPVTTRLTHAAGLVFAHHNAPIHRLTALARRLADGVKAQCKRSVPPLDPYTPDANRADYEILESFDHVGPNFEAYRRTRVPAWIAETPGDLVLRGADLGLLAQRLRELHDQGFPTRQIHRASKTWRESKERPDLAGLEKAVREDPNLESHADRLVAAARLTGPAAFWYHLAQLWDYVARVPAASRPPLPPPRP